RLAAGPYERDLIGTDAPEVDRLELEIELLGVRPRGDCDCRVRLRGNVGIADCGKWMRRAAVAVPARIRSIDVYGFGVDRACAPGSNGADGHAMARSLTGHGHLAGAARLGRQDCAAALGAVRSETLPARFWRHAGGLASPPPRSRARQERTED